MINKKIILPSILLFAFSLRLLAIYFVGDESIPNEWKQIIFNLENYNTFGLKEVNDKIIPTVLVPPLYPLFLYLVKTITFNNYFAETIFILQSLFAVLSIYFIYKILQNFYSDNLSKFSALVFSLIPINIYSATQFSSISIQVFLLIMFIYFFYNMMKNKTVKNLIFFSFVSGLLMLLRGEFILFYFFSLIYFYFENKSFSFIFLSIILTSIIVSPYMIRNYHNYKIITITKSFGFNLWRGNNNFSSVEGGFSGGWSDIVSKKIKNKTITKENYKDPETFGEVVDNDVFIDNYYKKLAIENIKKDSIKYFLFYTKKLFSFIVFDFNSSYPNYYNPLHLIPKIILSFSTIISILMVCRKKTFLNYLSLFYILNVLLISVFFILPRYSVSLLPIQIILSAYILKKIKPNF